MDGWINGIISLWMKTDKLKKMEHELIIRRVPTLLFIAWRKEKREEDNQWWFWIYPKNVAIYQKQLITCFLLSSAQGYWEAVQFSWCSKPWRGITYFLLSLLASWSQLFFISSACCISFLNLSFLFFKLWKYDNTFTGDFGNTEQSYI